MQHDVAVPDAQREQLASLPANWAAFQNVVEAAGGSLEDAKEGVRERVRGMVDAFGGEVADLAAEFAAAAPFSGTGFVTQTVRTASSAL